MCRERYILDDINDEFNGKCILSYKNDFLTFLFPALVILYIR